VASSVIAGSSAVSTRGSTRHTSSTSRR
jgi:hypothetical protein